MFHSLSVEFLLGTSREVGQHTIGVRPSNLQIFGYAARSLAARRTTGHRSIGLHVKSSLVLVITLHSSST